MAYDRDADREALLEATLLHAPFDGWSRQAMKVGAEDCGLSEPRILNAFPGGMAELLDFFHRTADAKMLLELQRHDLVRMRVRDRIALALRIRLEQNFKYREAIRAASTFLSWPQNMALGAKCLYRTVDAIWYAAGDRSTDYNFYTKRGLLAAIYGATILYWLNDSSAGYSETFAFIDRQLETIMAIPKITTNFKHFSDRLPNPLRILNRLREARRFGNDRSHS